jgi:hypothetical protein
MVYVFSALDNDEVFDVIIRNNKSRVHRVQINAELLNNPISISEEIEKGSLLIFDDIDVLPNKLRKYIYELINSVLQIGRHFDLSIVVTSHLINGTDRNANRVIMSESHYVVLFLFGLSRKHVDYFGSTYVGLDKTDIKNMYKLAERSIVLSKNYPMFYMTPRRIIPVHFE